jgi:Holliday junction resolvase RusA-like endonuclease
MAGNRLDIDINPVPYKRMTYKGKWAVPGNQRYFDYKKEIQWRRNEANYVPSDALEMRFFIPMPKSWSKSKEQKMLMSPHNQKPDLDNLVKAVLDALFYDVQGGDCKVHKLKASKIWTMKGQIEIKNMIV